MPHPRLKANWFSLSLTSLLLVVAVTKYRHGMLPVDGIDLCMPYTYARVWLGGDNPYDADKLTQSFIDAGGGDFKDFDLKYLPPIYPAITCIVMTPISLLRWDQALHAWTIGAPILVAILIATLLKLAGIGWRDPRVILLVLFCIAFAPIRSAVTLGQNALPAFCMAMLAVLALSRRREVLAGCLLAVAIGFKVQDGLFILLYFALVREWRAVGWCIATLALMTMVVIVRAGPLHPWWVFDVLHWIREASRPGDIIDPAPPNGARFQMIHLPVLLFTVISSRTAVAIVNLLTCGTLLVAAGVLITRRRKELPASKPDLLSPGILGALSLLPLYHRFPDAIILLLPMTWAISRLGTPDEGKARVILLLLLPLLIQPYEVFRSLVNTGKLSRVMYEAWWFQCFARASVVWILLLLTCWLTWLLWRRDRGASAPAPSA